MIYDVIVLGAGASGMMAAIHAAREGKKVCVIEIGQRVGKKILATGNGKCNLTNLNVYEDAYRSHSLEKAGSISSIIDRFDNKAVIDFFKNEGMLTRNKDTYVYPYSEQASSVLDCLRNALNNCKAKLYVNCRTKQIDYHNGLFNLNIQYENMLNIVSGKTLILATGSNASINGYDTNISFSFAKKAGHCIVDTMPALVPLVCKETFFKQISGVRAKGNISLFSNGKMIAKDGGEIQFTDNGISGIPVFQVSRYAVWELFKKNKVTANIDLMPEYSIYDITCIIEKTIKVNHINKKSPDYITALTDSLTGIVNKKVMSLIIRLCDGDSARIAQKLKNFDVTVVDSKKTEFAQVLQGGIRMDEIDNNTMESKKMSGLFFCGEILDVDGICGGYNLQWAWTSGYIAGISAAKKSSLQQKEK